MKSIGLSIFLFAATTIGACDQHAKHANHAKHTKVDERGDQVMGFSHEKTKHTFRLYKDGGAVEVRANEASDAESIAQIRSHLKKIANEFAAGEFGEPKEIHARMPDGLDVMKELGDAIRYEYREIERGAVVRATTSDPRAIDAVHRFLRFQISDHRTGDSGLIESPQM